MGNGYGHISNSLKECSRRFPAGWAIPFPLNGFYFLRNPQLLGKPFNLFSPS